MKYEQLIDFIRSEMKKNMITQTELSRRTNISKTTLNNYLVGERIMPADYLLMIMDIIGKHIGFVDEEKTILDRCVKIGGKNENRTLQ